MCHLGGLGLKPTPCPARSQWPDRPKSCPQRPTPAYYRPAVAARNAVQLSTRLIWPFLRLLREQGLDLDEGLALLSTTQDALADPDARVPHTHAIALLDAAVALTNNPALGLQAAERIEPGDFDLLEYTARTSATVRDAMLATNRYLALIHEGAEFSLDPDSDTEIWQYTMPPGLELPPIASEFMVATFVLVGRNQGWAQARPLEVRFRHPKPLDTREHQRIFASPLRFGCPHDAIVYESHALNADMPSADLGLHAVLSRAAQQQLEQRPRAQPFSAEVRQRVAQQLHRGDTGVESIAAQLGLSPRTFRRRLQDEGTHHKRLVDQLKQDLALQHLQEDKLAVSEVGFLLGFSDPSAFHKAFKRWTGTTPREYRLQQRRS